MRKFQLPRIENKNRSISPKLVKSKRSQKKLPISVREVMKHNSSSVILPALNKRYGKVVLPRSSDRSLEGGDTSLKLRFLDRISKKANDKL